MPIAIHCGDPKAFWKPATPDNERWDELQAHPEWSFYGSGAPSWQQLYDAFERRIARHPKTPFIAVHFGDDPADPDNVARARPLPQFLPRHGGACPGNRPPAAGPCGASSRSTRIAFLFGTDTGISYQDG